MVACIMYGLVASLRRQLQNTGAMGLPTLDAADNSLAIRFMNKHFFSYALLALTLGFSSAANAQWQWVDDKGRKVFSDRPPPHDIPANRILKKPKGLDDPITLAAPPQEGQAADAAASADAAVKPQEVKGVANVPAATGVDPELQKKLEAEEQARERERSAVELENKRIRAANCATARRQVAQLEPGRRIVTVNDKGETVYMDDNLRAARRAEAESAVRNNCE